MISELRSTAAWGIATSLGGATATTRSQPLPCFQRRFVVRTHRRIELVPTTAVLWIAAAKGAATLHTATARYRLNRRLNDLEAALDPEQFLRIHRSALVRLGAIERLETDPHGELALILGGGLRLRVGRQRQARVRAALLR